jgi:FkbM family methyltransferase
MLRTSVPWRKLLPNRTVRRHVQGVDLYMPWSHVLPDYARARDYYGQNLVELSAALARRTDGPFRLLDVGANIGDSALQVLRRIDGRVLCVEGDPYWVRYLLMNVRGEPRVTVEQALLTPSEEGGSGFGAVRNLGTTRFEHSAAEANGLPTLAVDSLRERHSEFADVRLVKSDTDGFDPRLVPALARTWRASSPVLFFEFDPALARSAGDADPGAVWAALGDLGYGDLLVWDNTGDPLGRLATGEAPAAAATLDDPTGLGYTFWDVAARRSDDADAGAAFDELVSEPFDPRGAGGRSPRGGSAPTSPG